MMSPLPAAASELFHYLMPRGQPPSTTAPEKSFKGLCWCPRNHNNYWYILSFERRALIYLIQWFRFLGPSIQDEQREKQLSPLEAVGQILKRSVYTRVSPVIENGDETKPRTKAHDKSPPSYKVDPFVNHLNPFSIFDKIKVHIYELYSKITLVLQFTL